MSAKSMAELHVEHYGKTAPWMRGLFRSACDDDLDQVFLSMGRGGAKTAACSTVAAATFADERARGTAGDVICVASSFDQARTLGRDAVAMLDPNDPHLRFRDAHHHLEVECQTTKARLRVLGADAGRAHGWRPRLILFDEPAQWKPNAVRLYDAARTALGKYPDARLVGLGTRAEHDGHWWNQLLAEPPVGATAHVWAARPDVDPADRRAWHAANPSLRTLGLPNPKTLANEAAAAADDPAALARFRALRLNAGTPLDAAGTLFDPDAWAALPAPGEREGPLMIGVDLGGSASLSAVAGYWPATGRLEAIAACGDVPDLRTRGRRMGIPGLFERALAAGTLLVTAGRNPSISGLLEAAVERWGAPDTLVTDNYKRSELLDVVEGTWWTSWCQLVVRGGQDRSEDLRRAIRRVNDGQVGPVTNELLDRSVAVARIKESADGQLRMEHDKHRPDDVAAAAVLAIASGDRSGFAVS